MPRQRLASPPAPPSPASEPSSRRSSPRRTSPPATLLYALVDLAAIDDLDDLLDAAEAIIDRELHLRGAVQLWADDDTLFSRGHVDMAAHTTWVGIRYTIGAIHVAPRASVASSSNSAALTAAALPATTRDALELLALQLAPLAERLLDRYASHRRTIRDDIKLLYERRIRDALIRHDWNASAVARELRVGRTRVAEVAHRWRARSEQLLCDSAAAAIANNNSNDKVQSDSDFVSHPPHRG